jgi:glycosyltransferase involved in cell wall biosynthesis
MTIQKNITTLLMAAKEVIFRVPKTIFLIVGDGDQYNELIGLAAALGISKNVIFTGFQRGKQWRDSFAMSDLFVMPSVSEPFGLTPIEALFYDVPSLISHQSGVGEIYNNCLKVDCWDVNEIANQITAVLQNPGLHETLVTNAKQELEHLTWDKPSQHLMDIYQQQTVGVTT